MFLPGQKVVCVDDSFPEEIKKFYWKLPINGVIYTIRDLVPGCDVTGADGEMCVYLVEVLLLFATSVTLGPLVKREAH
jgi:hypothetical protein